LQGTVVFNLRGHRITATTGPAIRVRVDGSPTIKNGSVTDSRVGLEIAGDDSDIPLPPRTVTVSNLLLAHNHFGITAPYIGGTNRQVTHVAVVRSRFDANWEGARGGGPIEVWRSSFTNNGSGIHVDTGELIVKRSYFADNQGAISCYEANRCSISDSRLVNNAWGLSSGGWLVRMERTKISGSKTAVSVGRGSVTLMHNRIYDNQTGVDVGYAAATLIGNRFLRNQTGFTTLNNQSSVGSLTRNTFVRNGDGIFTESPSIELGGNLALRNGNWGIYAPNATDLGGNRAHANGLSPQCVGVICT
jgi:hypothetical protein